VWWPLQCFESSDNSSVRKSSMLCLVALHDKVGKDLLPLLASLNPSKVPTTKIFIFICSLLVLFLLASAKLVKFLHLNFVMHMHTFMYVFAVFATFGGSHCILKTTFSYDLRDH